MGAVSMTTKPSRALPRSCRKAWKTATSCEHGERESSASSSRCSTSSPLLAAPSSRSLDVVAVAASGSIAAGGEPGQVGPVRAAWPAGSVVEVHEVAAACELGGDDAGDRGLADATLAGHEDDTAARLLELIDESC